MINSLLSAVSKLFRSPSGIGNQDLMQLMPIEEEFLRIIKPLGPDWKTPCQVFIDKYGAKNSSEQSVIVIELPPAKVFSEHSLSFEIFHAAGKAAKPPNFLRARFNAYNDARKNFEVLEQEMSIKLGPGKRADHSTSLVCNWIFGAFKVELIAMPPDMQSEWVKASKDFDPSKFNVVTVTVTNSSPILYIRNDLEWIVNEHVHKVEKPGNRVKKLEVPGDARSLLCISPPSTYRNPPELHDALEPNNIIAWANRDSGIIGISNRDISTVIQSSASLKLTLYQITADRGPEGAQLSITAANIGNSTIKASVLLMYHDSIHSLDSAAEQLAGFWNIPLEIRETAND